MAISVQLFKSGVRWVGLGGQILKPYNCALHPSLAVNGQPVPSGEEG